jgi:sister chromatid cohesion protein DCC1
MRAINQAIKQSTMATQYSTDIPFSASRQQQSFKLLELPPELLAALESDTPPT